MVAAFDPMAGMKSDEPLVDDITAGEAAKFIGKNTPYYLRIFSFINKKSRFNFSAFILSGNIFSVPKMYGLGVLFSALVLGSMVGSAYISSLPAWKSIYTGIVQAQQSGQVLSLGNSFGLSPTEFLLFSLSSACKCGFTYSNGYQRFNCK